MQVGLKHVEFNHLSFYRREWQAQTIVARR